MRRGDVRDYRSNREGSRPGRRPVREIEKRHGVAGYLDCYEHIAEEVVQNVDEADNMSLAVRQAKEHIIRLAREHELFINATRLQQWASVRRGPTYSERLWVQPERKRPRSQPEFGDHATEATSIQRLPRRDFHAALDSPGTSLMALRCAVELFAYLRSQNDAAMPVGSILNWAHNHGYGVDDVLAAENILTRGGLVQRSWQQIESPWTSTFTKPDHPRSPTELLRDAFFGVSDTPGGRGRQELLVVVGRQSVHDNPTVAQEGHLSRQTQIHPAATCSQDCIVGLGAALPPQNQSLAHEKAGARKRRNEGDSRLREMHSA